LTVIKIHPAAGREVRDAARWYQDKAQLGEAFRSARKTAARILAGAREVGVGT
jgi:hypothetical protein